MLDMIWQVSVLHLKKTCAIAKQKDPVTVCATRLMNLLTIKIWNMDIIVLLLYPKTNYMKNEIFFEVVNVCFYGVYVGFLFSMCTALYLTLENSFANLKTK